jgi:hypothetical protein
MSGAPAFFMARAVRNAVGGESGAEPTSVRAFGAAKDLALPQPPHHPNHGGRNSAGVRSRKRCHCRCAFLPRPRSEAPHASPPSTIQPSTGASSGVRSTRRQILCRKNDSNTLSKKDTIAASRPAAGKKKQSDKAARVAARLERAGKLIKRALERAAGFVFGSEEGGAGGSGAHKEEAKEDDGGSAAFEEEGGPQRGQADRVARTSRTRSWRTSTLLTSTWARRSTAAAAPPFWGSPPGSDNRRRQQAAAAAGAARRTAAAGALQGQLYGGRQQLARLFTPTTGPSSSPFLERENPTSQCRATERRQPPNPCFVDQCSRPACRGQPRRSDPRLFWDRHAPCRPG